MTELSGTATAISGVMEQPPNVLLGGGFLAVEFLWVQQWTLTLCLYFLTILVLFTSLARKQWLAGGLAAVLCGSMIGLNSGTFFGWVAGTAVFGLWAYILIRWGLISAFVAWFSLLLLIRFPITADIDAWYWASSLFALGAVAALGVYGFYTSVVRPAQMTRQASAQQT